MTPPTYVLDAERQRAQAIHNVGYHRPALQVTQAKMEAVREAGRTFITEICGATSLTNMSRERQMALSAVEDAVMYAIAGLARHEPDEYEDLPNG